MNEQQLAAEHLDWLMYYAPQEEDEGDWLGNFEEETR